MASFGLPCQYDSTGSSLAKKEDHPDVVVKAMLEETNQAVLAA